MTTAVSSPQQRVHIRPPSNAEALPVEAVGAAASTQSTATMQAASGAATAPLLSPQMVGDLVADQAAASDAPSSAVTDQEAQSASRPHSSYESYMPTREGFSAYDLAVAVRAPGYVSSSAGKTGIDIATDARARMDEKYARMAESGEAFNYNSREGRDWYSLMGDLDPKSLAAVRDNVGGLFTEQEQSLGLHFLQIQESFRAGGYNGPTRLFGQFVASGASFFTKDEADRAMKDWDAEAAKQPDDFGMLLGRAAMRMLLGEDGAASLGMAPKDRMMTFLVAALQKAREDDPDLLSKTASVRTVDDLKKQDWFQDSIDEFDEILRSSPEPSSDGKATSDPTPQEASIPI